MIEDWEIQRQTRGGRMISVAVTLSDWLFRAVLSRSVLTLSRDYFRLRKPLERRIYELARKHCGRQPEWRVSIGVLHHKSGAASPVRVFRKMVRDMVAENHLPDYLLAEGAGDILIVTPRAAPVLALHSLPPLSSDVLATARALVPGQDIHALEAEWRAGWARGGRARLRSPGAAFLGWVKKRQG
jgi:plasmid replication initiation protein